MKRLVILGSTGSIGTQTLDVVRKHPDRFEVLALVAGGNAERLAAQVEEFRPAYAALATADPSPDGATVPTGPHTLVEAARHPDADLVVNAVVGSAGLPATLAALEAGAQVALANKESLVAGGDLVAPLIAGRPDALLPIDSEHSGLLQCLAGVRGRLGEVRRMILTASGGPFRGRRREDLAAVTVEEALAHPTWRMGRKITVDSATLMNKGLEAIEAHRLFGIPIDRVEVVVHPRSIIHGIVEFIDGSNLAQAAHPDMRLPIQVALAWPERLPGGAEPLEWATIGSLAFEPVDRAAFPCLALAEEAAGRGGTAPAVLNAANEEAVAAFLARAIPFLGIPEVVERALEAHIPEPVRSLEVLLEAEQWARRAAGDAVRTLGAHEGDGRA